MEDIAFQLSINAEISEVFDCVSRPDCLNQWWTRDCQGIPALDETYTLDFGPGYIWKGKVTIYEPPERFELSIVDAHEDWLSSIVSMDLFSKEGSTSVKFTHKGWKERNEHFNISSYCWPMYFRILKRYLEYGETVPYEQRLEV